MINNTKILTILRFLPLLSIEQLLHVQLQNGINAYRTGVRQHINFR